MALRERRELPKIIAEAPELLLGLDFFYNAFLDLMEDRTVNGFIPWTCIHDYCKAHGYDRETTEDVVYFVKELDRTLHQHQEKTRKKDGKSTAIRAPDRQDRSKRGAGRK